MKTRYCTEHRGYWFTEAEEFQASVIMKVCDACKQKRKEAGKIFEAKKNIEIQALRALPYREYLQTEHWQITRRKFIRAANRRCQRCGDPHPSLEVHHLSYRNKGDEVAGDCIALCPICHSKEHGIEPEPDKYNDPEKRAMRESRKQIAETSDDRLEPAASRLILI